MADWISTARGTGASAKRSARAVQPAAGEAPEQADQVSWLHSTSWLSPNTRNLLNMFRVFVTFVARDRSRFGFGVTPRGGAPGTECRAGPRTYVLRGTLPARRGRPIRTRRRSPSRA